MNYSFENMIHEISSMMGAQAGKSRTCPDYRDRTGYTQGGLCGDRVKIQEILTNLISNGIKYDKGRQRVLADSYA